LKLFRVSNVIMVTRRQAAANTLPPRERRPPASKDLPAQPKKTPASKNPPAKAVPKAVAPVKGILKKPPPPPPAEFVELSPDPEETPVPSSPPVSVKSTPQPPSFVVLCSVEVTVDKEHLFATAYTLDFGAEHLPGYTTILVDIGKELDLTRYAKPVLIPTKWACGYGAQNKRQKFDIRTERGIVDWDRFLEVLKVSRNKTAEVLIEYGSEYPPGGAPIDLTKGGGTKVKKESVVKRPFEEQPSDVTGAPPSSSNEPKKPRVTSTSQLLDSHKAEVRAQTGTIHDY
jgi:hypothetical protein